MADDYGAGRSTNGQLIVGTPVTGLLEVTGDRDFFRMDLQEGTIYRISLEGEGTRIGGIQSQTLDFPYNTDITLIERSDTATGGVWDVLPLVTAPFYAIVSQSYSAGEPFVPNTAYSLSVDPLPGLGGTSGNDWVMYDPDESGYYSGGAGRDMLSFLNLSHGVGISPTKVLYLDDDTQLSATQIRGLLINKDIRHVGFERFTGTAFDDFFLPESATTSFEFRGMDGNDWFETSLGATLYDGGAGSDTVSYFTSISGLADESQGVQVSLLRGQGWGYLAEGDRFINIENINGSWGADVLTGDRGDNEIWGATGQDTLIGNAGDDRLIGGSKIWYARQERDVAVYNYNQDDYEITRLGEARQNEWQVSYVGPGAGDGTDTLVQIETLRFADGDLYLGGLTLEGQEGAREFVGGIGFDTVTYNGEFSYSTSAVQASLLRGEGWTGYARGHVYRDIDALRGSHHGDVLTGDHADNFLFGLGGDDTLIGNAGTDVLYGDDGTDVAVFSYDRDQYFIGHYAENSVVTYQGDGGAGDGHITLYDIEVLRFADGDIIL